MSPTERAARELAKLNEGNDSRWEVFIPDVHCVLAAYRKPSTEMVADGEQSLRADGYAEFCWQAMIDAAVQEG